jgi:hypothetical protein
VEFCSPGLDPVVVVVPWQKTSLLWVRKRLFWCLRRSFLTWFYLFWVFSLESDLFTPAGFYKARASPRGSPASSSPTASNHGRAGSPRSVRGLHMPGRSLPDPACVGHDLSPRVRWVAFLVVLGSSGGFLMQWRSSATALPDAYPVLVFCLWCFLLFFSFHNLLV